MTTNNPAPATTNDNTFRFLVSFTFFTDWITDYDPEANALDDDDDTSLDPEYAYLLRQCEIDHYGKPLANAPEVLDWYDTEYRPNAETGLNDIRGVFSATYAVTLDAPCPDKQTLIEACRRLQEEQFIYPVMNAVPGFAEAFLDEQHLSDIYPDD